MDKVPLTFDIRKSLSVAEEKQKMIFLNGSPCQKLNSLPLLFCPQTKKAGWMNNWWTFGFKSATRNILMMGSSKDARLYLRRTLWVHITARTREKVKACSSIPAKRASWMRRTASWQQGGKVMQLSSMPLYGWNKSGLQSQLKPFCLDPEGLDCW